MNYGCNGGWPHEYETRKNKDGAVLDFANAKWEICIRCGRKIRWKKDSRGRVDNNAYLKAHIRNFCQPWGATRKTFIKIYHPQMNKIRLCLDAECVAKNVCKHVKTEVDYTKRAFKIGEKGSNDPSWRKKIYGI